MIENKPQAPVEETKAPDAGTQLEQTLKKLDDMSVLKYPKDFGDKLSKKNPDLYAKISKFDAGTNQLALGKAKDALDKVLVQIKINDGMDAWRKIPTGDPRSASFEIEMGPLLKSYYGGDESVLGELGKVMDKIIDSVNTPVEPAKTPEEPMDRTRFLKENTNLKQFYNYDEKSGIVTMNLKRGSDADKYLSISDILGDIYKGRNILDIPKFLAKVGEAGDYHFVVGKNGRYEKDGKPLYIHGNDRIQLRRKES